MMKVLVLKIIGKGEVTGYGIIKKIGEITGQKPSSGTIYPILRTMADEGWIEGREQAGKTYYTITDTGRNKLAEFFDLKKEYMQKLMRVISVTNETFNEECWDMKDGDLEMLSLLIPLFYDVRKLRTMGVPDDRIKIILKRTRDSLKELEDEYNGKDN